MVAETQAPEKKKKGGARPGSGRPKGATTLVSRRRADMYARDGGVLPVDVMMGTMRRLWDDAHLGGYRLDGKRRKLKDHEIDRAKMREANEVAKDAAPYIHHKLAAMEHTGKDGGSIEVLVKRAAASLQVLTQAEFDTLMGIMTKLGMVSASAPGGDGA